ncbi:MAG: Xaa-Pro peptidase family protein [Acidobacteriota bacterium]|nr:Xaa-Pro peptidase family protein [Acidobacteriota bacterium]MDE2964901.1 Xaa-Pro peptidase family protein [Acidobacteriota bacterium]
MAYLQRATEGVTLLFNRRHHDLNEYVPDKNFYYLTGCTEPGAVLLLIPGEDGPRETLFVAKRDPKQERWTGPRMAPGPDTARLLGMQEVLSLDELPDSLAQRARPKGKVYANLPAGPHREAADKCCPEPWVRLRQWLPETRILDAGPELAFLRMKKSEWEIEKIRRAVEITIAGHRHALPAIGPGRFEYEVEAAIEYRFRSRGATRPAFPSIVGSGPNAAVLHYADNNRRMISGDLVVIDVGAEFEGYSADLTRTYPVSGRFTPRQKEIYNIVLAAQEAALKQVRPGVTFDSIHRVALETIDSRGRDRQGGRLGRYFIHGTGHHLGLEVHDPVSDRSRPLEPGMVITIEPGIYIPEENLGIRIEDDVLVTRDGYRVLSRGLPRKAEEVERMMRESREEAGSRDTGGLAREQAATKNQEVGGTGV